MSVLILQGPHAGETLPVQEPLPSVEDWAGHDLHTVRCRNIDGVVAGLRAARASEVALVVLDGGDLHRPECGAAWPALREALDQLPVPYIELHEAGGEELEPWLHPRHLPLATLVTLKDRARGYAMSRAIAVRRLGAARAR